MAQARGSNIDCGNVLINITTNTIAVCAILFLLRQDISEGLLRDQPLLFALVAIDTFMRRSALIGLTSFVLALAYRVYYRCTRVPPPGDSVVAEPAAANEDHED